MAVRAFSLRTSRFSRRFLNGYLNSILNFPPRARTENLKWAKLKFKWDVEVGFKLVFSHFIGF